MTTPFHSMKNFQTVYFPVCWNTGAFCFPIVDTQIANYSSALLVCSFESSPMTLKTPKMEEIDEDSNKIGTVEQNNLHQKQFSMALKQSDKNINHSELPLTRISPPPQDPGRAFSSKKDEKKQTHKTMNFEVGKLNWTIEEEQKLKQLVSLFGKHWRHISEHLPNRNPKQIRERYLNYLRPNIHHGKWTPQEDERLMSFVKQHGHSWKYIEKQMKNRSQNQIKNRYYGHLRRKNPSSLGKTQGKQQHISEIARPESANKVDQQLLNNINVL